VLSFFFELGASCIRPVYYGLRPFMPFEYTSLIKKKKQFMPLGTPNTLAYLSNSIFKIEGLYVYMNTISIMQKHMKKRIISIQQIIKH
jgi:hypothetical protein